MVDNLNVNNFSFARIFSTFHVYYFRMTNSNFFNLSPLIKMIYCKNSDSDNHTIVLRNIYTTNISTF